MALSASDRLKAAGYEDTIILDKYSYDDALVGVTTDERAVYDFDKMVAWLMDTEGFTMDEAIEWVEYNTIRALPYAGPDGPIILHRIE